MKLKLFNTILGVVALAALTAAPAAAAIIFADNFNTPAFPVGTSIMTYTTTFPTTPQVGSGTWAVTGAGIDHVDASAGDVGSDGGAWVDLNASDTGGLELTLLGSVVPGTQYVMTFMTNTAGIGAGSAVNVDVTNGTISLATKTATPTTSAQPVLGSSWQPFWIQFTAASTNDIVVKLSGTGLGPVGAYVDQLVIASEGGGDVPEPSTLILGGIGLVAMALVRRRS